MIGPFELGPPDGRWERQFADALTVVIGLVLAVELVAWLAFDQSWAAWGIPVLGLLMIPVRRGRRLAIDGQPRAAARLIGGGLTAAALIYAFILPALAPVLALVPLEVMALLLPHAPASSTRRRLLFVGALAVAVAILFITALVDPGGGGLVDGFVRFALVMVFALTLLLFAQYDSRVRETMGQMATSEQRLRAVVDTAADGVLVIDDAARVTRANQAATALFGRDQGGLIGQPLGALVAVEGARPRPTGSLGGQVTVGRRSDGRSFPAEVSIGEPFGSGAQEQVLVVRDVTERARAAAELARRADALVRSNRELERFAYVASHDLQEPLRKIQAFGGLLDESARDRLDPEEQQALDYLIDAATRQRALINDLLAYSRARTRPRQVGEVDLGATLAEVLDDLSPAVAEKAAVIETDALPVVRADPSQMRQLLQNLISNALKYAALERRPRITVRCAPLTDDPPSGIRLSVADNGIGFEDRFAERIFEPFRRLHPRHTYPGSGVGLAICRQIAERHGGHISARGVADAGATFTVELPIERIQGGAGERRAEAAEEGHDSAG